MHSVAVRITGQIMKTPNYKRMGRRREGEKHLETETCGETSLQHPNSASTTLNSWQGSTTTTNRYYKKECIYTTSPNVPRGAKISNTSFPSLKASTTCVCVCVCVCDHKKVYSPNEKRIPRSYTTLLHSKKLRTCR